MKVEEVLIVLLLLALLVYIVLPIFVVFRWLEVAPSADNTLGCVFEVRPYFVYSTTVSIAVSLLGVVNYCTKDCCSGYGQMNWFQFSSFVVAVIVFIFMYYASFLSVFVPTRNIVNEHEGCDVIRNYGMVHFGVQTGLVVISTLKAMIQLCKTHLQCCRSNRLADAEENV